MMKATQKRDPKMQSDVQGASNTTRKVAEQLQAEVISLAPSILNLGVRKQIEDSTKIVQDAISLLLTAAQFDNDEDPNLALAAKVCAH
jgi:hypothetical protein